jgi:hypothetical protein
MCIHQANKIPFDEAQTVCEKLDCNSKPTRLITREHFIALCVYELEIPTVNVIYVNDE